MQAFVGPPLAFVGVAPLPSVTTPAQQKYVGDGRDILLQAFHWDSHRGGGQHRSWYRVVHDNAERIKKAGFTSVWMPPPSDSLAPEGYIPRRWNVFNTCYGSEAELRGALHALAPLKPLADVVINHRVGVATSGADFEEPRFPDNRAAIVSDDDSGAGTGNRDTGELSPAGRDLDHSNPQVRHAVIDYLRRLKAVGFRGWRYDLTKGFHGRFIGEYNDATAPEFSVGEYFDGERQKLADWVDITGGKSATFDFPTRFRLFDACTEDACDRLRASNGGKAGPVGLIGLWPSRAVTFLDNHDTEYRREEEHRRYNNGIHHFPGRTAAMGYAYLLTHPGVPCVFWSHLFDWDEYTRQRIEQLLALRKHSGIHARSHVEIREARQGLYAAFIDGKVAMKLGSQDWHPGGGWQLAVCGDKFAVWKR